MLRSLYSGISGMKNFQTKLDVIGNNISNVNTYGFKKGRTTFSDLISQTVSGATAPANGNGGTNSKQIGLGSQLSSIDTVHTQGPTQYTGRGLDLAISGEGYFVVEDGEGNPFYTRAGNFYFDEDRNIVTSSGLKVSGVGIIPATAKSYSIGTDGTVTYVAENGETQNAGQIVLAKFNNPEGLEKVGGNIFQVSNNSGDAILSTPGQAGTGSVNSSYLEMSNVDLSEEFTDMIVSQRGFQANTKIITTSDEILQELVNLKR
ncbi:MULTISPECIES: flagellar basal body rod protein FlgG [Niallia]|jgi:flagellar hook protein FlgE|uniref:flagellar basal body rod protein FlgG n=1 Tax=Niallia TaxID=2837506 RepID=UPI00156195B1|nr:flagellar basal body rod protein FlgG [Niallia circulans]NRG29144.1 flagellar basal body rod protein FlgG [Niallia circulans]